MVDVDAVVMYPNVAHRLSALTVRADGPGELVLEPMTPFLTAAMGIDQLRLIDTGLDPVTAEREQWDDGNNTLALAPRSPWRTSATWRPTSGSPRPASR